VRGREGRREGKRRVGKGKGENGCPPTGECGSGSGGGREGEKGKEGSLDWGIEAVLFSILSIVNNITVPESHYIIAVTKTALYTFVITRLTQYHCQRGYYL